MKASISYQINMTRPIISRTFSSDLDALAYAYGLQIAGKIPELTNSEEAALRCRERVPLNAGRGFIQLLLVALDDEPEDETL